ncbi:MAG TPA: pilus assembly protein N-terminal domain-containing protein [Vitreimonas sp.]|uniref:pilus assembly protein N-terminal domain-containing protein n=1 Tax=Vitreimonas sp. TaxID=3069702 RepID=UPI002D652AE9|nr:pilus assembly protein N-terminal domain-containing protein [Vitreimonas sp.]HYD86599.1 pilus assembly protein N-terminal domain-containing protein [Vitreimonas sp.]
MRALRTFAAALAVVCTVATPALARDVRVALDQAFPIRLAEPAEGVAIGNPAIAGVSVQNDRFLFVTGRSYGSTNLVVVGAEGRVLYSGRVVVTPDETDVVMVTRGVETARLECTPLCRPRPDIGDGAASEAVTEQITSRAAASGVR